MRQKFCQCQAIARSSADAEGPRDALQGQFVIHRLGLAMINPHTKFEISMFTHYEDMKANVKCRNLGGLGRQGHPSLPVMSPFDTAHSTSYSTLTETMCLSCTVFEL